MLEEFQQRLADEEKRWEELFVVSMIFFPFVVAWRFQIMKNFWPAMLLVIY